MLDPTGGWANVVECSQMRQDVGGDMKAGWQWSAMMANGNLILLPCDGAQIQ